MIKKIKSFILIYFLLIIFIVCNNNKTENESTTTTSSTTTTTVISVTFIVTVPQTTPQDAKIYISGNFENWSGGKDPYVLSKRSDNTYEITIKKPAEMEIILFKFTRGGWATVEKDAQGNDISNRSYKFTTSNETKYFTVLSWADFPPPVSIPAEVADSFDTFQIPIPQLNNRIRNIRVYLPPDYKTKTDKRYPVIYMHDAQNIFAFSKTEQSNKWNVDLTINKLFEDGSTEGAIVVGIDNGANRRGEYCPWEFNYPPGNATGNGEGVNFAKFIVETLKPKIDNDYRTLTDRNNTAMIGSSTGAVITLYCAIKYQNIFSKVACLSANFIDGVNGADLRKFISETTKTQNSKIYIDMGTSETFLGTSNSIIMADCEKMYNALIEAGYKANEEVKFEKIEGGTHNEANWSKRFGNIYLWLFK